MRVEKSVEITALPEKVWSFLINPDKVLLWYTPLQKFEYTSEQHAIEGTPLYFEEKVAGRLMKFNCVVTECIENKCFAFKMTSGSMMKSYEERWTVSATPGGCRFTFMEQGEMPYGFINKIINPFAEVMSGSIIKKMLNRLKSLVEI